MPTREELEAVWKWVTAHPLRFGPGSFGHVGPLIGFPNDRGAFLMTREGWMPVTAVEEDGAVVFLVREPEA